MDLNGLMLNVTHEGDKMAWENATKRVSVNNTMLQFTTQIGGNNTHKIDDNVSKR